jgi:hypothetical protein
MTVHELASGVGFGVRIIRWAVNHWGEIRLRCQCSTVYRKRRVRISMASLVRIKVAGKYLLVRGNRIPDQFQPVGGVYKFYGGARDVLDSVGAVSDIFAKDGVDSEDDLRRVLQQGVKLPAFLKWFHSRCNRETDPRREFNDEVLSSGILPEGLFAGGLFRYRWVKSVGIGIRYSPELEIPEYTFADVFELMPNADQRRALQALQKVDSDSYVWVDERCIRSYGQTCGIRVGSHSWKILEGAVEPPRRS